MAEPDDTRVPSARIEALSGGRGKAFIRPPFDAGALGYVDAEFAISGEARLFRLHEGTGFSADGAWRSEVRGRAPYRTRIVVRRPRDPARFNGTVIVVWNNVTAGFDNIRAHPHVYEDGFILVGATVQRVGIEGFDCPAPQGLHAFDRERYGTLHIPTDDAAFDIFGQIGAALRAPSPAAAMALGGMRPRHILARGGSQSAAYLTTYINGVAPFGHPFDGFLLDLRFGNHPPLETPPDTPRPSSISDLTELVDGTLPPGDSRLRDPGVPIFVVNTETEARSHASVRQPDTDRYRLWEAAGVSHAGGIKVSAAFTDTDLPPNGIDIMPLRDTSLWHMQRWLAEGIPPPILPRIELADAGPGIPPRVVRDADGIAIGGLRLPEIAAPLACHTGFNSPGFAFLRGSSQPFPAEDLRRRYGDLAGYLAAYEAAAASAVATGILLPDAVGAALDQLRAEPPAGL